MVARSAVSLESLEGRRLLHGLGDHDHDFETQTRLAVSQDAMPEARLVSVDAQFGLGPAYEATDGGYRVLDRAEGLRLAEEHARIEATQEVYGKFSDYEHPAIGDGVVVAEGHGHDDDHDHDHDHVGEDGLELHVLPAPSEVELAEVAGSPLPSSSAAPFPLSQTFELDSRPGAEKTVYLDFDGSTTTGTSWNNRQVTDTKVTPSTFTTPAFNAEGSPSTFTDNELSTIQNIWERVSEDFRAFDINITTREPSADDLLRTTNSDSRWGVTVAIGGNGDWYAPAGGVAFVGVFPFGDARFNTAFVFSDNLGDNANNTAIATSHEIGHTLGLQHDGRNNEYYAGHGPNTSSSSRDQGWGPIMGAPYNKEVVQWSRGDYNGATQTQNDLNVITSADNGFGYIDDDHSDSLTSLTAPTELAVSASGSVSATGIISNASDEDGFRFEHGGGALDLDVTVKRPGPNLDAKATLYEWTGFSWSAVQVSEPSTSLDASVSGTYDAGTYMLRVDGDGWGNPTSSSISGWSDYGSQGLYTVSGTVGVADTGVLPETIADADIDATLYFTERGETLYQQGTPGLGGDLATGLFGTDSDWGGTYTISGVGQGLNGLQAAVGVYGDNGDGTWSLLGEEVSDTNRATLEINLDAGRRYVAALADVGNDTGGAAVTLAVGSPAGGTPLGLGGLDVAGRGGRVVPVNNATDTEFTRFTVPDNANTGEATLRFDNIGDAFVSVMQVNELAGGDFGLSPVQAAILPQGQNTLDLTGLVAGSTYSVSFASVGYAGINDVDFAVDVDVDDDLADNDTPATATDLGTLAPAGQLGVSGRVIGTADDVDVYTFTAGATGQADLDFGVSINGDADDSLRFEVVDFGGVSIQGGTENINFPVTAGGTYTVLVRGSTAGAQNGYSLNLVGPIGDTTAPEVTGLWLGSSSWSAAFLGNLDPVNGLGFDALADTGIVPWSIDRVSVRFSEDVTGLDAGDLTLPGYGASAVSYDASTFTATFTLSSPVVRDRVDLGIGGVADAAGNDASPFSQELAVLRGDADRNGRVDGRDVSPLRLALGNRIGSSGYNLFADLNGDGAVDGRDVSPIRQGLGDRI